jgi:hypothetical protein
MCSVCKVAILHKILLAVAWFFVSAVEKSYFVAVFVRVYGIFPRWQPPSNPLKINHIFPFSDVFYKLLVVF